MDGVLIMENMPTQNTENCITESDMISIIVSPRGGHYSDSDSEEKCVPSLVGGRQ